MNLYIDEYYNTETEETILAVLKMTERDVVKIYSSIRKIIINKEPKKYRSILTELKSKNIKGEKYWFSIISKISSVTCIKSHVVIPYLPKNAKQFKKEYIKIMRTFLMHTEVNMVYADAINNKKYMEEIIRGINNERFKFCDSRQNKGIQLADLVAATYKDKVSGI